MSEETPHQKLKELIDNLMRIDNETPLKEGQIWYIVDASWYRTYETYIKEELPSCSKITNQNLIERKVNDSFNVLKKGIEEKKDYLIASVSTYNTFDNSFGSDEMITRKVVKNVGGKLDLELYPLVLEIVKLDESTMKPVEIKKEKKFEIVVSKTESVLDIIEKINSHELMESFKDEYDIRLWNIFDLNEAELLAVPTTTAEKAQLVDGQKIMLEIKKKNEQYYPTDKNKMKKEVKKLPAKKKIGFLQSFGLKKQKKGNHVPGVCGLRNMGNTCFMNTALQCISNCKDLTEYFLEKNQLWKTHINKKNPLGNKGKVARRYHELISKMWSGDHSSVTPRDVKSIISEIAPQFIGYRQHDTQEFMMFLLDGIHEDLNKVQSKPQVPTIESKGRDDKIVAKESWKGHQRRNKSVITDIFQKQLKSRLECPDCHKVSVTFQPFMCLSVPILKQEKIISVILLKSDPIKNDFGKRGTKYNVTYSLSENRTTPDIGFIRSKFGLMIGFPPEDIILAQMDGYSIKVKNGILKDNFNIGSLDHKEQIIACLHKKTKNDIIVKFLNRNMENPRKPKGQCIPFVMPFTKKRIKGSELYDICKKYIRRFTKGNKYEENYFEKNKVFYLSIIGKKKYQSTECKVINNNDEEIDLAKAKCISIDWPNNEFFISKEAMTVDVDLRNSGLKKKKNLSLLDCLKAFSDTEQLSEDNSWYCPECKKHVRAYKTFQIWSLPTILIIQLKRFKTKGRYQTKIGSFVDYPVTDLDLSNFTVEKRNSPVLYDLFAVANHSGGLGGGHYTAYAKNFNNNNWYHFNDSSTQRVTPDHVVSSAGYVLFYRKKTVTKKTCSFK